jgi:hypothetical protein
MWLVSFDNLSDITKKQADHLCRISTGGGSIRRTLYANNEITTHSARRPLILNGISELATRGDLANRCVQITLPSLKNSERKTERELWAQYDAVLPRILGGFFNALSCALRNRPNVSINDLPRMSDGALLITAAEPELQWESGTFIKLYNDYRKEEDSSSLGADPFAVAVSKLINNRLSGTEELFYAMTAESICDELNNGSYNGSQYFPQSGRKISDALLRIVPFLKASGIDVIPPGRKSFRFKYRDGSWSTKSRWWKFIRKTDPDFPPESAVDIK